jgi:hypothetical protein
MALSRPAHQRVTRAVVQFTKEVIMELSSKKVYQILKSNGVEQVHHANSVVTSCQFLRTGALLSRGSVIRNGLLQTPQKSDSIDKKHGIWFDVFTDSVDIHERTNSINLYGPVLFILDIDLLEEVDSGKVWVTKLNPTKWNGKGNDKRWFTSTSDLAENFVKGRFDQMIVFRNCGGELQIRECLKQIILDDPQRETKPSKIDYYSMAYGALRLAMTEGKINVPIVKRKCLSYCSCLESYNNDAERTKLMYSVKQ